MPIVALVGRPNVGKSTLFNRLIGEHRAVVHEKPGTTRDRLYGTAEWRDREFTVIDTGGIGLDTGDGDLLADVRLQAEEAMRQADIIVWVVDAATGLTGADYEVADQLRPSRKPVILSANKSENQRRQMDATAEFSPVGFGEPVLVSALHGEGTGDLLDAIVDWFPKAPAAAETSPAVSIAIVGRPNVGKSSLVNSLIGSPRSIVRDDAGTTRDAIDSHIVRDGQTILLIDTAGIRRRGRVQPGVEKFSVMRAVRAIERADQQRCRGASAQRPRAHPEDLLLRADRHGAAQIHLLLQRPADGPLQLRPLSGQHPARALRFRRHPHPHRVSRAKRRRRQPLA